MSFTDKFIRFPIMLYNKQQAEITGKQYADTETYLCVDPFTIATYRPATADEKDGEVTLLKFKDGESVLIYLTVKEFEEQLNQHHAHLMK